MSRRIYRTYLIAIICYLFTSCSNPGVSGLFGKRSLHEQYGDRITQAGLKETTLGRLWFQAAENSLNKPLAVSIPYSETGYFSAEHPSALGIRLNAKRGEQLIIDVSKKPADGFLLYMDLLQLPDEPSGKPHLLVSADSSSLSIKHEVRTDGNYIIRLQPELLKSGEYTLSVTSGPSLAFPFSQGSKASMASFWGAARDRGARKHEGIDILAPNRTPTVAAAEGTIVRVNENRLGGKTVWLRPDGKDYTLYYAHLDEQLVSEGQRVSIGDTVGLVGTTGNAKGGAPHLHFGIYTNGGAIDPFPFLNPTQKIPSKITASLKPLGELIRTDNKAAKVFGEPSANSSNFFTMEPNSLLRAEAATGSWYRVFAPDGSTGYISSSNVNSTDKPIRTISIKADQPVYDAPHIDAPRKKMLEKGGQVSLLAVYRNFYFIEDNGQNGWIVKSMP